MSETEYTPDTLRAAFSDPLMYILPPGSMTLEREQVVAGKFADAWEKQVRELAACRRALRAWDTYHEADMEPPGGPHDPDPAVAAYTELQTALALVPPTPAWGGSEMSDQIYTPATMRVLASKAMEELGLVEWGKASAMRAHADAWAKQLEAVKAREETWREVVREVVYDWEGPARTDELANRWPAMTELAQLLRNSPAASEPPGTAEREEGT